jgi:formyl-CoA transferase
MTPPDGEPIFQPPAFFDLQGANTIAGAVGTALYSRERTGEPTEIDVSLMSVGIWALSPDVMAGPYVGSIPPPNSKSAPNPITNVYGTADGRWLYLVCLQSDRYWGELCTLIGRKDLLSDERFVDLKLRAQNCVECIAELAASFAAKTLAEWRETLAPFTGVWAPVLSPAEIHDHVQVAENGYLPEITANSGAVFRLPAPPAQYGGEPPVPRGPAPELGQHTEEILLELGLEWAAISDLRSNGAFG